MPLFFVLLFNALNSGARVSAVAGVDSKVVFAQFYTPAMGVFGLLVACYTTLIMGVANARDNGLLKRVRGTPLPMPIYLGSWSVGAALVGFASVLLMFAVAVPVYGVHVYLDKLPLAVLTLLLGAFALTGLGLAVASLVRDGDQAMPIAQMTMLPISFISGVFFPVANAPEWPTLIAKVFPLYHLREAFGRASCPAPASRPWTCACSAT
jgi:ABC-2 type transport system permease protein